MLGIKGNEKEGKWFASASNQNRFLDPRERGNWLSYFRISILISRAVKRMHAAGLAHSDLSYKNVLVDPAGSVEEVAEDVGNGSGINACGSSAADAGGQAVIQLQLTI